MKARKTKGGASRGNKPMLLSLGMGLDEWGLQFFRVPGKPFGGNLGLRVLLGISALAAFFIVPVATLLGNPSAVIVAPPGGGVVPVLVLVPFEFSLLFMIGYLWLPLGYSLCSFRCMAFTLFIMFLAGVIALPSWATVLAFLTIGIPSLAFAVFGHQKDLPVGM